MVEMGKPLAIFGVALIVIGGVVMLLGRTGLPLGRLPGDILYQGKNITFYFPLATSIMLSCSRWSCFSSTISNGKRATPS